jgi:hypothetical protein
VLKEDVICEGLSVAGMYPGIIQNVCCLKSFLVINLCPSPKEINYILQYYGIVALEKSPTNVSQLLQLK